MINHSLLALSKCIRARVNGTKPNYRESKLTRLLEDSLSGSALTTMVCTVSPGTAAIDETLQTLARANEVKMIKRPAPPPRKSLLVPPLLSLQTELLGVDAVDEGLLDLLVPHESFREVSVAEGVHVVGVPRDLALLQPRGELLGHLRRAMPSLLLTVLRIRVRGVRRG